MKITIIYDNEIYKKGLKSDWGFSCLVEIEDKPKILFDTGADGRLLLSNMEKLGIDPTIIDVVFISHNHFDHIGGLSSFLNVNNNVKVYVPNSVRGVRNAKEVISVTESLKIYENIFSTGELSNIEQSLVIQTEKGLVVIAGCSHPGVSNILEKSLQISGNFFTSERLSNGIYSLIGGFHGFKEFDLIKVMTLIIPCHCTKYKEEIKSLYPDKYIDGSAGKIIDLGL